ncbi:hypothetical protein [Perlabentimonas gracilis]|jgi:hypothetical protein|uniref:hypothetical protein n=1 Tax=Perlabentimonas gracilis TaxID=2715279 RepID=UPI00140AD07E|nr:hypothetical protein [Perlabentimonas gracilis]NHB67953.1 hypothetical protein [Perlabentimonas gracilis]
MEKTITLNPEQTRLLHEICSYADAKELNNKLHLIGIEASVTAGGSSGEDIGEYFNLKQMLVSFLESVENDVRQLR